MMAPTDEEEEDVLFDHRTYRQNSKTNSLPADPVTTIDDDEDDIIFDQAHLLANHLQPRGSSDGNCYRIWITVLLFFAFCGLGLCIALPGPTLLDLQDRTNTDTEGISRIFIGRSTGYLVGSVIGGFLIDRMNKSFLMSMFLLMTSITTAILPWCTKLYILIIMIALQGIAMGFVDTAANLMCVQTWGRKSPPYMQTLHFFFGLGAFVAPLIAEPFLSQTNATVTFSSNSTYSAILASTPSGPAMGKVIPLSGRDVSHFALRNDVFHRETRDTDSKSAEGAMDNLRMEDLPASSKKPKKPSVTDGKSLNLSKNVPNKNVDDGPPPVASNPGELVGTSSAGSKPDLPVLGKRVEEHDVLSGKLQDTTPILDMNSTSTPKLKPKPKKPLTNGGILSSDKNVAAGKNIPKPLVEKVKKGPEKLVTKSPVLPIEAEKMNTTVETNAVIPSQNNATQGVSHTPVKGGTKPHTIPPTTSTIAVTTTGTTPSTTTATAAETPRGVSSTVTSLPPPPPRSDEQPNKANNSKLNSDQTPLKPTATVNNSTEDDSFITRVKTQVKKTLHYFTTEITKVQFAYLIVSIFLMIVSIMVCGVCCCQGCRKNQPVMQSYNFHQLQQHDSIGFKVQIMLLLFLFSFVYVGMEVTFGGFVMSFSVDYLKWEKSDGTFVTALFWGSFALTRLVSIVLAKCVHPPVMLIIDLLITCISLLALLLTVNTNDLSMWICTSLLGIGMASFFPTMLSWAERYINVTGKITATLVVGAALGEMAMPTLTGFLFEAKTPMFLIYILFAASLFCCIIYIVLQNLASNRGEKYSLLASIPVEEDREEDIEMDRVDQEDLIKINVSSNHVNKSNNHIEKNSSGCPVKKVTFNLEDDVQLLQDSSASDK